MKQKIANRRKLKTRKYAMYGGAPSPAPRPAPAVSPGPAFAGFDYTDAELRSALDSYLQAAYSIRNAANAIKETSIFQNKDDPTNVNPGTRYMQRSSSASFKDAAATISNAISRFYSGITMTTAPIPPSSSPPPLGSPPYPPFSLGASYLG
jgi:hypothetical protein